MPIRVTFLGTAGSTPTRERNLPGVAVEYDGKIYLFDCGEGSQRQMMLYGLSHSRVRAIFLTHMHGDHVIGVAGLVRSMALSKRAEPLEIFVPGGEEKKLEPLMTFDRALILYKIEIRPVKTGAIFKGRGFTISAFRLRHSAPTFGYSFKENSRYKFDKQKCAKLGLSAEMYRKLSGGLQVRIKGKSIRLRDVAVKVPGRKLVYAADTRPSRSTVSAAAGADLLIHESTFSDEHSGLARQRLHSTAAEAAAVAKKAKVKELIIFHMSARYRKPDELIKEARKVFHNTEGAYDGMQITL